MDYRIPINTAGIGEVLLKKRYGVALLGIDMGMATYQAADVTLTFDYLKELAGDISIILNTDSLPMSYRSGADELWKEIGFKITMAEANSIYRTCIRREFKEKTPEQIANMIVREVTTHELKHK